MKSISQIIRTNDQQGMQQKSKAHLQLKQANKVIYPRRIKGTQQQLELVENQRERRQLKEYLQRERKLFVQNSQTFNSPKQEASIETGFIRSYQPILLQSCTAQKATIQNRIVPSRLADKGRLSSEKHVLQQSGYKIQGEPNINSLGSKTKRSSRILTQVVGQVGIRNNQLMNKYKQDGDPTGINQVILPKKQSVTSSILRRALTEPTQKLESIKQVGDSPSKKRTFLNKNILSRSQSSSKTKHDAYMCECSQCFPKIKRKRLMSQVMNRKVRAQSVSTNACKMRGDGMKLQVRIKLGNKLKTQKSPSQRRLRQDYNYVVEKDDSQRYNKRVKPLLRQQEKKICFLKVKEQMLGRIVFQRVQKLLKQDPKQKQNYITRVKSQKSIDQALIEFLKMKIKRADKALS